MTQEQQILQMMRDQLPVRWAKDLSVHVLRLMALELGYLSLPGFRPTKKGKEFGVKRLMPRDG